VKNAIMDGKENVFFRVMRKMSITNKLILLVFLVVFIPVILVSTLSISLSVNSLIKETKRSYLITTQASSDYFENIFSTAKNKIAEIMQSEAIQNYYSQARQDMQGKVDIYKLKEEANKLFQNIMIANPMFSSGYILVGKDNSLTYPIMSLEEINFENLKSATWYQAVIQSDEPIILKDHFKDFDEKINRSGVNEIPPYAFSVAIALKDTLTLRTIGVILLDISLDWFKEALQNSHLAQNGGYMLAISPEGDVIVPSKWSDQFKSVPNKETNFVKRILELGQKGVKSGSLTTSYEEKEFLITFNKLYNSGWYIVGIVALSSITNSTRVLLMMVVIATIIFTIAAIGVGSLFALRIANDIKKVAKTFSLTQKGNLSVKVSIKRNDEIGILVDSFNEMIEKLKKLIINVVKVVERVVESVSAIKAVSAETSSAATEISKVVEHITDGANEQAKEISNIYTIVNRFGEKIEIITHSINKMKDSSCYINSITEKGESAFSSLNGVTQNTVRASNDMIINLESLIANIHSIEKVIKVLNSITEQTKLLALNASIEAAKAGDLGRGFAVVASEIRKLADQSKTATREAETMLKKIIEQSKKTQQVKGVFEEIVKEQYNVVEHVSKAFLNIKNEMDKLLLDIEKVNESVITINNEKNIIIESIKNISLISEQTAASSEEIYAAIEEQVASVEELYRMTDKLNTVTVELQEAIKVFKF
jgi:methyl-accepting chemotaxis protein